MIKKTIKFDNLLFNLYYFKHQVSFPPDILNLDFMLIKLVACKDLRDSV